MENQIVVTLSSFERRLLVNGMTEFRNQLIAGKKPTEDIDRLILKVIHAQERRTLGRPSRDAR